MTINTLIKSLAAQIKKQNAKLPKCIGKAHKITDDNQSIKNGVINEKSDADLRSSSNPGARCG
jgi:hypothetical protein